MIRVQRGIASPYPFTDGETRAGSTPYERPGPILFDFPDWAYFGKIRILSGFLNSGPGWDPEYIAQNRSREITSREIRQH